MKILIVGTDTEWALEKVYHKYLKQEADVTLFNAHGIFLNYFSKNIFNKIIFRAGFSQIFHSINKQLLVIAEKNNFDVIWVWKGMEIYPKTLKKLKAKGAFLVNYNPDHPFEYFSRGNGNTNVLNGIKYYDMHFSYSKKIIKRIENEYKIPCFWLPFGYEKSSMPDFKTNKTINKVCFIGNPDAQRVEKIQLLLENNLPVDVYGNGWKHFLKNSDNLALHGPVYGENFTTTAQRYSVQLNVFRPHNIGSHNMRSFEMPAIGCIMLAPKSEEHLELFKENTEAFYYTDNADMLKACKTILNKLSDEELNKVKENAYYRSVKSDYSYEERAKQVLKILNEAI